MIEQITLLGGKDKSGKNETIRRLDIESGQIYSIVGYTGSGKSQLISDFEQMAQNDTISERRVLINGNEPDYRTRYDPDAKLVGHLSQNMNFALEMTVADFIMLHAECRGIDSSGNFLSKIIDLVNELAGEPIKQNDVLTRLSGGQSRALMITDVSMISNSPIVLIDEIENAGIDKRKALSLMTQKGKIVLVVTHNPQLALVGDKRVVMQNGGMAALIERSDEEVEVERLLDQYNSVIMNAQNNIRNGKNVTREMFATLERD